MVKQAATEWWSGLIKVYKAKRVLKRGGFKQRRATEVIIIGGGVSGHGFYCWENRQTDHDPIIFKSEQPFN